MTKRIKRVLRRTKTLRQGMSTVTLDPTTIMHRRMHQTANFRPSRDAWRDVGEAMGKAMNETMPPGATQRR